MNKVLRTLVKAAISTTAKNVITKSPYINNYTKSFAVTAVNGLSIADDIIEFTRKEQSDTDILCNGISLAFDTKNLIYRE